MSAKSEIFSPQSYARTAGILYLVITVAAIVAHFYVPDALIVAQDSAATVSNIRANPSLFRLAIGGEMVVLLSEIVLSVLLYFLLKPVNKTVSLIGAVSRLIMTAIHGLNLINYYFVLMLINGSYAETLGAAQVNALAGLFLDAHSMGFTIGIAFLTIHVFALGYLILRSGYFPRVLGVLFLLAGVGYTIDSFAQMLVPAYQTTPALVATVIAVSEIAFPVWLLVKGVNLDGWQKRATVNAQPSFGFGA